MIAARVIASLRHAGRMPGTAGCVLRRDARESIHLAFHSNDRVLPHAPFEDFVVGFPLKHDDEFRQPGVVRQGLGGDACESHLFRDRFYPRE